MSSHRISASGDRPYTLTAGGGAFSAWQVPSKQSDAVTLNASGFSKIEAVLLDGARIEKRRITTRTFREGDEPTESEILVLVMDAKHGSSLTVYGWPSGDLDNPGPENTNIDIRKPDDRFGPMSYYADWEVLDENVLEDA